jgi:methyltransferase (TIGR00027 family)
MAFYCCGARMEDAQQTQPVCDDAYAKVFMGDRGLQIYGMFKDEVNCNASMLVRHRMIDDLLRDQLASDPTLRIITIGAGLDSRPYRLIGGTWVELDEPAVVSYKNKCLSAGDSPNSLTRIAIDFNCESLEDKLIPYASDNPVVLVFEGIFIYLDENEIKKTIETLHRLFPKHQLICDLVNRKMVETYGKTLREKIEGIGTTFKPVDNPEAVFIRNGYRVKNRMSIVETAADFGINKVPKFILRYFFSGDINGNSVYVFEPHELYSDLVI